MRVLAFLAAAFLVAACSRKPERVELEPGSLRFYGRAQRAKVHATPWASTGRPMPDQPCAWSSSDERVATVVARHNDAVVTSAGPGTAKIRCEVFGRTAEIPVTVRVVTKLVVSPAEATLRVLDEPRPLALEIQAIDDQGAPVAGRIARTRCADEAVCRGDARGQLWAVGPGLTTAVVEIEGASKAIAVRVVDARTAAGRPRRVAGNPMLELEREVRAREAAAKAAR